MPKYCIADLIIDINAPEWALDDSLVLFSCISDRADIYCDVLFEKRPVMILEATKKIAEIPGKKIYEYQDNIHIFNQHEMDIPSYRVVSKNWSACTLYLDPQYLNPKYDNVVKSIKEGIFVALRDIFIGLLAHKNGVMIHSSSIIWRGKGIVFSAHSGTGKSTQAHLWQQKYNTPILDGDVAVCRIIDATPVLYGLPWCGTSGEFMNKSVSLGAIIFLQQAKENSIIKLDLREVILHLTTRCFLLSWNNDLMSRYLDTIEKIAHTTECFALNCLPDLEAVELVNKCLEKD